MERETSCNFEDIYYNMEGQTEQNKEQQDTNKLLHDQSSKTNMISIYCTYIYNYLVSWFFPSHINSLYK